MKFKNHSEAYRNLRDIVETYGDAAWHMLEVVKAAQSVKCLPEDVILQAKEKAKDYGSPVAILFNGYHRGFDVVTAKFVIEECVVMTVYPTGELKEGPAAHLLPVEELSKKNE
jgi:hypothetical protein